MRGGERRMKQTRKYFWYYFCEFGDETVNCEGGRSNVQSF
jgi:hypothetical protein